MQPQMSTKSGVYANPRNHIIINNEEVMGKGIKNQNRDHRELNGRASSVRMSGFNPQHYMIPKALS